MSGLTPAWLRTIDNGNYTFRVALIHDYGIRQWPWNASEKRPRPELTEEMLWHLTGSFDASDSYETIGDAERALEAMIAEREHEWRDRESELRPQIASTTEELWANLPFSDIRRIGVWWAEDQAADDPDRDNRVAA